MEIVVGAGFPLSIPHSISYSAENRLPAAGRRCLPEPSPSRGGRPCANPGALAAPLAAALLSQNDAAINSPSLLLTTH
jgi:hypothetical protein